MANAKFCGLVRAPDLRGEVLRVSLYPLWESFFYFVYIKPKRMLKNIIFSKVLRGV